jgi:hypothetical protein
MSAQESYIVPLKPTFTGHTLPFATGGVFQLPKHITEESQAHEPTPKPSPGLGILPNAVLAEAARLDAIERDLNGVHFQEGSGDDEEKKDDETKDNDEVQPPKAPSDLNDLIKQRLKDLAAIRAKEGRVTADGKGSFDPVGTKRADKDEKLVIQPPAGSGGKCNGKWVERYVQDRVNYRFVLWEHEYGVATERVLGASTSADEPGKVQKLLDQCDADSGVVRRAVDAQVDKETARKIADLAGDLKSNGFPVSWIQTDAESWVIGITCPVKCNKRVLITASGTKVEVDDTITTMCHIAPDGEPYWTDALDKDGNVIYERNDSGNRVPKRSQLHKRRVVMQVYIKLVIDYAIYARVVCDNA